MKERIAIVAGCRTPMVKAGTLFKDISAEYLVARPIRDLLYASGVKADEINDVIVGNCAQPVHAANMARVAALIAGLPKTTTALTVHRNCASGMEAITSASMQLLLNRAECIIAAGVESMSNIPLLYNADMTSWFVQLFSAKKIHHKLRLLLKLRPHFFKPIIGLLAGLKDPICNQLMGQTAENLAQEFNISREEQDAYALNSHVKALDAMDHLRFKSEILPVPVDSK
mgnify:CR=1 FL=1